MFTKISVATIFAGFAAAQLHPAVGEPSGNPILRPLNEIVPACKPFTIVWQPTTPNTVSVLLLKGPATNVVKFGPSLAEGIANSGSLTFTPSADLEATTGPNGYGLQIIDDVTGQYQYSTQFGFSKADCAIVSSSSAAPAASPAYPEYPVAASTHSPVSSMATPIPYHTAPVANTMAPYPTKSIVSSAYGTGAPHGNSSSAYPSGAPTGNATTSRLPEVTTNAASPMQAGATFAGLAAALALIL